MLTGPIIAGIYAQIDCATTSLADRTTTLGQAGAGMTAPAQIADVRGPDAGHGRISGQSRNIANPIS